jgi:hypothetical protein
MKKNTLIVLLLFALSWQTIAQISEVSDFKGNELKLDVVHLITGPILKVEYERLFNAESSWGIVGYAGLFNSNRERIYGRPEILYQRDVQYQLLSFFRLYFGKQPASGIFLEGNFGLISGKYDTYINQHPWYKEESYTTFGVGMALGWKLISKSGFAMDIFVGTGRPFGEISPDYYQRIGLCLGKRFGTDADAGRPVRTPKPPEETIRVPSL